jgi:anaerobic ribonucleoside-triphosphate reductase activating protein
MSGIEGVTLTGGEPFEQAEAFADFAWIVRAAGLSVMAFTGYDLDELESPAQRRLLAACDIVVAGRYVEAQRAVGEGWRGSMNQSVHFLSDRYAASHEPDTVCEFHLHEDGRLALTGFPPDEIRTLFETGSSQAARSARIQT